MDLMWAGIKRWVGLEASLAAPPQTPLRFPRASKPYNWIIVAPDGKPNKIRVWADYSERKAQKLLVLLRILSCGNDRRLSVQLDKPIVLIFAAVSLVVLPALRVTVIIETRLLKRLCFSLVLLQLPLLYMHRTFVHLKAKFYFFL